MSRRFLTRSMTLAALGIGFATPHVLTAQNNYTQQMQGYMNNYAQNAINRGYQVVTPMVTGSLNQGSNTSHTVTLTGGRNYVIIGVCDRDCSDVDLRLYDPSGNNVATDIATDDHPTLQFTAGMSGNYRLQVEMATCSTNPCYYGVQLFGGNSTGMALTPQPMAQPMAMQPQPMAMQPVAMGPTPMGTIAFNQQVTGNLQPNDGRFDNKPAQSWAFACTAGMGFQMDILSSWDNYAIVLDPMNNRVASDDDTGEGLNARINHTCTVTGVYRLVVTTYSTSTSTGTYTLQVQQTASMPMNQPQPMSAPTPVPMAMPTPQPMTMQPQAASGSTMPAPAPVSLPITGSIPSPGQIGTIQMGTNVQGRLETGDQRMNDGTFAEVWQFQGVAGQHVIVELRSEEFDTYV